MSKRRKSSGSRTRTKPKKDAALSPVDGGQKSNAASPPVGVKNAAASHRVKGGPKRAAAPTPVNRGPKNGAASRPVNGGPKATPTSPGADRPSSVPLPDLPAAAEPPEPTAAATALGATTTVLAAAAALAAATGVSAPAPAVPVEPAASTETPLLVAAPVKSAAPPQVARPRRPTRSRRVGSAPEPAAPPLGEILLWRGVLNKQDLARGLIAHRAEGVRLGEALIAEGVVTQEQVWEALAVQAGTELCNLDHHWVDPAVANDVIASEAIARQILPLRAGGGTVIVAMADPRDGRALQYAAETLKMGVVARMVAPAALRRRQEAVYRQQLTQQSSGFLQAFAPSSSAHITLTLAQKRWVAVAGVVTFLMLLMLRGAFFIVLAGAIIALYAAVVLFRGYVTIRGARSVDVIRVQRQEIEALAGLPVYTILCPLYREAGVLPQLVKACTDLEYPRSKLDVKLLLEEDDVETLEVVRAANLPPFFDVVVVPADGPRTKPKACNYGLQFARGEYCVIYDAEDIPATDQLKKALAIFQRSASDIGCVQGSLNYYNPRQNVVTKWFSLEYAAWFDFFLPGLMELGLPIPLGGSSNHFQIHLLRALGAWDPNNVTEDADLGIRLHRAGYQTVLMDSVTLEEANSDFVNWMRQRSRWGKGYFITWLVAMRHPRRLFHAVGGRSFGAIHLTLGGTFGVALLNLLVWGLLILWILAQFDFIAYLFPVQIYYVGMVELVFGNFFFLYMGMWSASHRRDYDLVHAALGAPAYWLMASLAMLKAAMQLFTKPTFWEKTVHGLFETTVPVVPQASLDAPSAPAGGSEGAD